MDIQQILKVLKNERECIKRQSEYATPKSFVPKCDRDCANCDLCLPDDEILEVYDHLIKIVECEAIQIADISEEDKAKIVQSLAKAGYNVAPELAEKYLGVDETARKIFNGICPYTNIKCEKWTCGICEVAERERRFAEGDTE